MTDTRMLIDADRETSVYCAGCGRTVVAGTDDLGHFHSREQVRKLRRHDIEPDPATHTEERSID